MDQAWLSIYRNFDDDALAALASVGLLRRAAKDLEAGKVEFKAFLGDTLALVQSDGQAVQIGADGPARARCDCPAPGICKHVLAAALWLRSAPTDRAHAPDSDALAEVMALEPAAVFKLAGAAATRKAAAHFAAAGETRISPEGGVLIIELSALELVCRYIAGAGFEGMVSEAPAASRAAIHLVALAVVWRDQGRTFAWPDGHESSPAVASGVLSQDERDLLDRLRQVVLEVCRTGWSHVSDIVPAQLRALGMSARIESFPRLAGLLRTLAGTAESLARRDVHSDERQAIKLAARVLALCHALEHGSGIALQELRGRTRRSFEGKEALELLPLGAHWWEQRSGARGLTISFWEHGSMRVMQAVLARRDANDPGFTRGSAWALNALWQGSGAANTLSDGALGLEAARLSNDDRIGLGGETRARTLPRWDMDDARWAAAGFDDWRELAASIRRSAGLSGEALECVLLKPFALESPQLDEVRQLLCWTLRDRNGLPLVLRLSCAAHLLARIEHIEAWAASGIAIKAVVARIERDTHGGMLEPVSLMIEERGQLRSIALDYQAPAAMIAPSFVNRIARMLKSKNVSIPWEPAASHLGQLAALLEIVENKAMTGRLHLPGEDMDDLLAIRQYLLATGLDTVANAIDHYLAAPDAENALKLVHLCHTCAELDTSFLYR
jgi:hypothetical protein